MNNSKINEQHLEWALTHLEKYGGTDVFPPTHDYKAIRANWEEIKEYILHSLEKKYSPGSPYVGFAIKYDGTFRAVHELDPIDSLIITACVYSIWSTLESARIPKDRRCVFSYRLNPTPEGDFFDLGSENWSAFSTRRKEQIEKYRNGFVLSADIADFYNQIYTHRVQNALDECVAEDVRSTSKFIHDFLNDLNTKISKGIPVGPSFSTVLAEIVLNDIDRRLNGYGLEFIRWVDDFYVFSDNEWSLWNRLEDLSRYLYSTHRLIFNGAKTSITSVGNLKGILEGAEDDFIQEEFAKLKEARCNELSDQLVGEINPYDNGEIDYDEIDEQILEHFDNHEAFDIMTDIYRRLMEHAISEKNFILAKHVIKKCTTARIRSIVKVVTENVNVLFPVIREVVFYLRRVLKPSDLAQYANLAFDFIKCSDSSYVKRWLSYLVASMDLSSVTVPDDIHRRLEVRDQMNIAMAARDLYRVKEKRTVIEQLNDVDRRAWLLSTSILTDDERDPILDHAEGRGRIMDVAYVKYVRAGIKKR